MLANNYEALLKKLVEIRNYSSALEVLAWDQETKMPLKGEALRADVMSQISGHTHNLATSTEMGKLLNKLGAQKKMSPDHKVVHRESLREYEIARRLPTKWVEEMSKLECVAQSEWTRARKVSNFKKVQPYLEQIIEMKKKQCGYIGYNDHPYDVLLDLYEPYCTTRDVEKNFSELINPLVEIIDKTSTKKKPASYLYKPTRKARFSEISRELLDLIGFDYEKGRLDHSTHPFSMGIHPHDVRITTRSGKTNLMDTVFSALHEGGHALYEQGLNPKYWGTPLCQSTSLGIHESQSRMWENFIGRSKPFWKRNFRVLKRLAPDLLKGVGLEQFYQDINTVRPSFIRVDADEATYSLHVILRFELEKELITGRLKVKDIPKAWNKKMKDYLGITPKSDAQGCLQDVHWYSGGIGYFPTYVLGNLYAAQFYAAFKKEHRSWDKNMEKGNMKPLLNWLRKNIHRHGSKYSAGELVKKVTGKKLDTSWFINYLSNKFC